MKIILILLITLYFPFIHPQSAKEITFIVKTENLPDTSVVFVTGNHKLLGNWNPGATQLDKHKNNEWTGQFSLPKDFHLEYKFTLGSWEHEARNADGTVPGNSILDILNDTILYVSISCWDANPNSVIEGQITGIVKYHPKMKGKGLKDRDVVVWLPPGYNERTDLHYPVLYMHDGQNLFDPKTSSFGVDWQIDEAADTLIRKNCIQPIIIVGIYNTPNRRSEYSENDTGYAYMNFIVNDLKPFIDDHYRTLSDREFTATGGSSLGGLISFMLLWEHSDVFSQAACLSPAFKISFIDFVTPVKNYNGNKKDIRIYIDNGGVGLEDSLQAGIDEMLLVLRKKGYVENDDLYWYKAADAKHFESDWAERIWRPLIYMFGNEDGYSYIKK
ncbi:MAG: alpha/beta hydrolase-fold protein [Ignavibacteriaceae bacterium]